MIWIEKNEIDEQGNKIKYWENQEGNRVYIVISSFGKEADIYFNNDLLKECGSYEEAYLFIKKIIKNVYTNERRFI